jgi:hypothetical protein
MKSVKPSFLQIIWSLNANNLDLQMCIFKLRMKIL